MTFWYAGRPVLEEMGGAMQVHEEEQALVQHHHVAITVHSRLGGRKKINLRPPQQLKQPQTITLAECLTLTTVNHCL